MDQLNEGQTAYLTVNFLDKNKVLAAPSSIQYRIDDQASKQVMKALTTVAAAASVELEIGSDVNFIVNTKSGEEIRVVTVVGTYGANDRAVAVFTYVVKNLKFFPVS